MSDNGSTLGMDTDARSRLLSRFGKRRAADVAPTTAVSAARPPLLGSAERYEEIRMMRRMGEVLRVDDPFFSVHDGITGATTRMDGASLSNYASYNYLGLNGDPRVTAAAKAAIDQYGTSVSASRIVSGERVVHRELERALADVYRTEDAIAMVSGHATNVTVIGCLLSKGDLIMHDSLSHNSVVQGAILSGAHRVSFPHNDLDALDSILAHAAPPPQAGAGDRGGPLQHGRRRARPGRADPGGASPPRLPDGGRGAQPGRAGRARHGIAEQAGVDPNEVDVWMGTLSKTLAGCGGYIAGRQELIDFLKFTAPGFVYSVGMPPAVAAAAMEALRIMRGGAGAGRQAGRATAPASWSGPSGPGWTPGTSIGSAITPVIVGSSHPCGAGCRTPCSSAASTCSRSSTRRCRSGRRGCGSSSRPQHEPAQIDETVDIVADEVARAGSERISMAALKAQLALR